MYVVFSVLAWLLYCFGFRRRVMLISGQLIEVLVLKIMKFYRIVFYMMMVLCNSCSCYTLDDVFVSDESVLGW